MRGWSGILPGTACIALMLLHTGCLTPTVRYTRGPATAGAGSTSVKPRYVVPADWDYRKSYKVPSARLSSIIATYIGVRYRYGGMSRKGLDCSGFVSLVFRELNHAKLPRSTGRLRRLGKIVSPRQAAAGDLIFFRGGAFNTINHVGIHLENGRFAHASTKKGVIYSRLDDDYYKKHFAEIRRIF